MLKDACTEYNTYGAVIQPHYRLKCSEVDPPCPGRYLSTDAYLYEGCYNAVKKNKDRILTETWVISNGSVITNSSTIPERITGSEDKNFYMLIFLVLLLVSAAVIIFVRKQAKTHFPCCNESLGQLQPTLRGALLGQGNSRTDESRMQVGSSGP